MKLTSYLARFAAGTFALFALAVVLDFAALPLFSLATGALLLVGAVADYAPRVASSPARALARAQCRECMPLAA